jgi:hypothetical protein
MNTEQEIKVIKYWNELSYDDRVKLLQENNFWNGFKNYRYQHIPQDLKNIMLLKIDVNALKY